MERKKISLLHAKYLENSLNADESMEWLNLINDPANEESLKYLMQDTWEAVKQGEKQDMPLHRANEVFNKIMANSPVIKKMPYKVFNWSRVAVAASILLIASLGFYFYNIKFSTQTQDVISGINDLAPGKNAATLTLADGRKILINTTKAGNIASQSGVKISKTTDGQIIYEITGSGTGSLAYNTLSTNRGEQTQVRLPDGTLVFLNAESSLTYPTSFAKLEKRRVSLTGEGYFEVMKDKSHPFVVKTSKQEVTVLGTHFNINSYSDEENVKTTLVEGSVKVSSFISRAEMILKPGQQSNLTQDKIQITQANFEEALSWKNGEFRFNDKSISEILKQIARWYDVTIVFNDQIPNGYLSGSISRSRNLSQVLKMMEKTKEVKFRIDGRKIFVNKYN